MSSLIQIKASAGSGKTYTLTERFLELLTKCEKGGRHEACVTNDIHYGITALLAITFTNAAAQEMRARIIKRLKETALGLNSEGVMNAESAHIWLNTILRDMNALNIRTIDSLLHMIVRSEALQLDLNPDFEIELSVQDIYEPHLDLFIDQALTDKDFYRLLKNTMTAFYNLKDSPGFLQTETFKENLYKIISSFLNGNYRNIAAREEIEKKLAGLKPRVQQAAKEFLDICASLNVSLKTKREYNTINGFLENKFGSSLSSCLKKESVYEICKPAPPNAQLENAYKKLAQAADAFYSLKEILENSLSTLDFLELAKRITVQENAIISNEVIPALAQDALKSQNGVSDTLCRLGTRLTHFLVDEFQDTSESQWNVLHALAEEGLSQGGSLYWVGDTKQSIYGWRGGKPELFDQVAEDIHLASIADEKIIVPLKKNWRSKKIIIEHTTRLFTPLKDVKIAEEALRECLGKDFPEEIIKKGAEKLSAVYSDVHQECADSSGIAGYVCAETVQGDNAADIKSGTAERICGLIQNSFKDKWSDVLILCRSNTHCRDLAKVLLDKDIPVITENSLLLAENSLVSQSVAFLEFIDNPSNNLAFWTVITGSIFLSRKFNDKIDEGILNDWAAKKCEEHKQGSLYEDFAVNFPEICTKFFSPFFSSAVLMSAYDCMSEWYSLMEAEANFPDELLFIRRFLEILHASEKKGKSSITAFVEYWKKKGQEERAPLPENANAVRIMTIHKAKGLEAPAVIIPSVDFVIKTPETMHSIKIDDLHIPVATGKALNHPQAQANAVKNILEEINLLYVAFTRAREQLFYFRPENKKKFKSLLSCIEVLIKYAGLYSEYTLGEPVIKAGSQAVKTIDAAGINGTDSTSAITAQKISSVCGPSRPWQPMQWLPRLKVYRAHPASSQITSAERGVFMHTCLEKLSFGNNPETNAQNALNLARSDASIPLPDDEAFYKGILDGIIWFASLPDAKLWIQNGLPEQTLINEHGKELRCDLLVPQKNSILVIDYKTGEEYASYEKQIINYMRCIKLTGQYDGVIKGLLIYLDLKKIKCLSLD